VHFSLPPFVLVLFLAGHLRCPVAVARSAIAAHRHGARDEQSVLAGRQPGELCQRAGTEGGGGMGWVWLEWK